MKVGLGIGGVDVSPQTSYQSQPTFSFVFKPLTDAPRLADPYLSAIHAEH
jgi:hypothetical protein